MKKKEAVFILMIYADLLDEYLFSEYDDSDGTQSEINSSYEERRIILTALKPTGK